MGNLQKAAEGMIMNEHEKEKEKDNISRKEQDKVQDRVSNPKEATGRSIGDECEGAG
jgi:hypothetical protein